MHRMISVVILGAVLAFSTTAPVAADDGCARALVATAGTPGQAFVVAHCSSPATAPETPASPATDAQAGVRGCAMGVTATIGTPGEAFVRAACQRLADQVGVPVPASESLPSDDHGCAIAELMTRDTPGHAWVVANCVQSGTGAATGAQSVAAGCDLAIQAVLGTTAEPFVRAGCAQAIAAAGSGSVTSDSAAPAVDEPMRGADSDRGTDSDSSQDGS
jgi:hypothetical protein